MELLDPKPVNSARRDWLPLCLHVASLLFTGWFIWSATAAAQWLHIPVKWLIIQSAVAAGTAWAASAAITLTLFLVAMEWERADVVRAALRTSAAAVWFAPAVILLSQLSPAALAGALMLVIYTTRLLYSQWLSVHPPADEPAPAMPFQRLFASTDLPEPMLLKQLAPALTASVCVQTGVLAALFHYPLVAGIGYAMSAAVVTVFALSSGAYKSERGDGRSRDRLPRAILGVPATILLAVGLTVGGLAPRLMRSYGWADGASRAPRHGLLETARAFAREILYGEHPGQPGAGSAAQGSQPRLPGSHQSPALLRPQSQPNGMPGTPPGLTALPGQPTDYGVPKDSGPGFGDNGFPGVILWPEVKPIPTLIAPMPQLGPGLFTRANLQPLSIHFSGEYWMFRWPFARPPRNSHFQRGSPSMLSFSTTDHRALQMEAHHRLDQPITLSCCSRIQLAIRNADRYPATVWLELFLLDSELPDRPEQSLGMALVTSTPDTKTDPPMAVAETLDFRMPEAPVLEAFDEFKVVFIRDHKRVDKSAKVAIDRFILVPR